MSRFIAAVLCLLVVGCEASQRSESAWVERAPMDTARSEHPAVVWETRIVVLGGLVESGPGRFGVTSSVESYDQDEDSWDPLPDLPEPRHHNMAAVVADRLYSIGGFSESGFTATDQVWELVDHSWVSRSPLPRAVGAAATVVLGDRIFVVGGSPGGGLQAYDPAADSWEVLPGPSAFREHLAAIAFQGEIWAIGGREPGRIHDSVEIYDPAANSWRPGPSLGEPRSGFGAVVAGEFIYVAGGEVFEPDLALDSTERFDPTTGEWAEFKPLPVGLHGNPLVTLEGRLLLPGGSTQAAGVENAGELWAIDIG